MPDNNEAITSVADTVKRYFAAHPNAADSVEGITRWWLARQRFEETTEVVEQALEYLAAEGEIAKTVTREGKILYSRTKEKR